MYILYKAGWLLSSARRSARADDGARDAAYVCAAQAGDIDRKINHYVNMYILYKAGWLLSSARCSARADDGARDTTNVRAAQAGGAHTYI